jgi:hypothetical protein
MPGRLYLGYPEFNKRFRSAGGAGNLYRHPFSQQDPAQTFGLLPQRFIFHHDRFTSR